MQERCESTTRARPAPAMIAQEWNTYMISTIPYRAQAFPIIQSTQKELADMARKLFRTEGWAP
eukprot:7740599-Prorocentrum_lima.AAC.1